MNRCIAKPPKTLSFAILKQFRRGRNRPRRHAVPHRGGDAAHDCRQSEAPWGRDRLPRGAPHLGPEPTARLWHRATAIARCAANNTEPRFAAVPVSRAASSNGYKAKIWQRSTNPRPVLSEASVASAALPL